MREMGGDNWLGSVQYPRAVMASTKRGSARLQSIADSGDQIGGLAYWREQESGLFIAMKKMSADDYLVFKTDDLAAFVPEAKELSRAMGVDKWATGPDYLGGKTLKNIPMVAELRQMANSMPKYADLKGAPPSVALEKIASRSVGN